MGFSSREKKFHLVNLETVSLSRHLSVGVDLG